MRKTVELRHGITDGIEGVANPGNRGANQARDILIPQSGESLGSLALRGLGYNSIEARERIARANSNLKDAVNIPKG